MKRITKQTKAIADAHINARISNSFNPIEWNNIEELKEAMRNGHTFPSLMDKIESAKCTITSTLLARRFGHVSVAYKNDIYGIFKAFLDS